MTQTKKTQSRAKKAAPTKEKTTTKETSATLTQPKFSPREQEEALDPKTPALALLRLAARLPGEVLRNPSFEEKVAPQLRENVLSNYAFQAGLQAQALSAFCTLPEVPLWIMERALASPYVALGTKVKVLQSPTFPANRLEPFLFGASGRFRWAASQHPSAPAAIIKNMQRLGSTWDLEGYNAEKAEPKVEREVLEKFCTLGYWPRFLVVNYPETPSGLLEQAGVFQEPEILQAIVAHPNCDARLLEQLSRSPLTPVRGTIAESPNTPAEILRALATQPDVQQNVAKNPNTPGDLLVGFTAKENGGLVRCEAAANPSLPPEGILHAAKDKELHVKLAVAANPGITEKASMLLAKEKNLQLWLALATNPRTHPQALLLLAKSKEARVKRTVAQNPSTPPEALKLLEKEKSRELQKLARSHPNNPAILRLLRVLFEAVQNANELRSELPERALLAFEAIAPQGFDPIKTGPLLSSLGESLREIKAQSKGATSALCGALEAVALGWSNGSALEQRVALEELRESAIQTFTHLGESLPKATKKIDELLLA